MATDETDFPYGLTKHDADFLKTFHLTLKELRGLVISNVEFYQRGNSSIHARYYAASCILFERLQSLEPSVIEMVPKLQEYDFSPQIPGNGYRSFVIIVNRCILHMLQLCRHINVNKNNLLFRSSYYLKELEAYVETLGQLIACLGYLKSLLSLTKDGSLFYEEENQEGDEILLEVEMLNTDCFYGRCLGFQFSDSMQKLLHGIMVAMATFSECYEESSQVIVLAASLLNSSKYIVDQDMRAKQVVNVTRTADIKFCKAFWSIPESPVLHHLRSFTFQTVEVSEVMKLEPENFELPLEGSTGDTVTITPPCAHTGPAAVCVRLISHVVREGMVNKKNSVKSKKGSSNAGVEPKSKGLLFHCHGGGFVAQSSQSHENYLRVWARHLKMPILSVDYSLAPEFPFPRALEESFYAYAWALKNPELLGWTGERVCFAGDSAGGNLVVSTALRAVSYQIRVPDGIMAVYPSLLVQYTPSPARLMSMIDPLLPVGILTRCLAAYAGIADKFSSALAKPIFCNPGKYESWEVVDSGDVTADSVGATISKELQDEVEKTESEIIKTDEQSQKDNQHSVHESTDTYMTDFEISNQNSLSCHSLEDLDIDEGFVVCDAEDLIEDSEHYKGNYTVIEKRSDDNCDTCKCDDTDMPDPHKCDTVKFGCGGDGKVEHMEHSDNMVLMTVDSDRSDLDTGSDVTSPKDVQQVGLESPVTSEMDCRPDLDTGSDVISQKDVPHVGLESPESSEMDCKSKESETGNEVHTLENGDKQTSECCQSIADALQQLDNGVVIMLDEVSNDEKGGQSDTDLLSSYATCQGFLSEQDDRFMKVDSDMEKTSCHSLEDLTEIEGTGECICNDVVMSDPEKTKHGPCLCKCCIKQSHNESNFDRKKTECYNMPRKVLSNPDFDRYTEFSIQTESIDDTDRVHPAQRNGSGDSKTVKTNDKLHRRSISLDFQTYHPNNTSPVRNSPSPGSRTPLSPRLPPGSRSFSPKRYSVQRKITQSPIKLFRHLPIVKNFYMSPMLAPDDLLRELPDVYLTACHFDPLLDDSIMFAKKLSKLGKNVDLQIVDHLPHGFLSFSDTSMEAKKAANLCLEKIGKVLQCENKISS